jgi:hypothetical protein
MGPCRKQTEGAAGKMKSFLLFPDRDAVLHREYSAIDQALVQDLELDPILDTMACGDSVIRTAAKAVMLTPLSDEPTIKYRQHILKDCLDNPAEIRGLYDIVVKTQEAGKKLSFGVLSRRSPSTILYYACDALKVYIDRLSVLHEAVLRAAPSFHSIGLARFSAMIADELSADYLASLKEILASLSYPRGELFALVLTDGNRGTGHTLLKPAAPAKGLIARLFSKKPQSYTFTLAAGDETGARALSEIRDRGISASVTAVAQATGHIVDFFTVLREELAFSVGALNLHAFLSGKNIPVGFPEPAPSGTFVLSFRDLRNPVLAITRNTDPVGNDLFAENKKAIFITGANQGGKTVFLRSIGLMQIMSQCGLFVAAKECRTTMRVNILSHFRREEDSGMKSGKLDEELGRMSDIVDKVRSGSLVLFNESFAATNEREGSEIASGIVDALNHNNVMCIFVTHLTELAMRYYSFASSDFLFLRANRDADGKRNFQLTEGVPLETTFGEDLYERIFT